MRKFAAIMLILLAGLIIFVGCEKKTTEPEPEPETFDPPTGLTYTTFQDSVMLTWNPSPDAGETGFEGYLLYHRENAGFDGLSSEELATYLVSPDPNSGTEITVYGLSSDRKHYFALKSFKVDGGDTSLSSLSGTVNTSPTIWFEDTLWEVAGGDSVICAIDFDNQAIYTMDLLHLTHIDIYLGVDDSNRLALKSPSLFGDEWADRETEIKRLGVAVNGLASFTSAGTNNWTDEIVLYPGESYAILNGSHYSKILIENWIGSGYPNRGISFKAAFQDVENYDHF